LTKLQRRDEAGELIGCRRRALPESRAIRKSSANILSFLFADHSPRTQREASIELLDECETCYRESRFNRIQQVPDALL
jgi:hypothetical protein